MKMTIQTTCLHWRNSSKQNNIGVRASKHNWNDKDDNDKTSNKQRQ